MVVTLATKAMVDILVALAKGNHDTYVAIVGIAWSLWSRVALCRLGYGDHWFTPMTTGHCGQE